MKILTAALCLLVITGEGVFAKKKEKTTGEKLTTCLKIKNKKARADCIDAALALTPGEWRFSEVTKSPINDAATVSAKLEGDSPLHVMAIGCYEGQLYVNFNGTMFLSTMNNYFYPIIYRVDSQPAVDCTNDESTPQACYGWALSSGNNAAGIWGNPDAFIDEIKGGSKLTVRLSNHSGEQRTMTFPLKDVAATYEKVKGICSTPAAPATEGEQ